MTPDMPPEQPEMIQTSPKALVHIGYGAFHRAHQAVYIQQLADQGVADWSIYAVNLRAADSAQFAIEAQKPGYDVTTFGADGGQETTRIDRHTAFFDWTLDRTAAEAALAKPEVTIATITVSEAGYYFDSTSALEASHPVIAAEIAGERQESIYAYLAAGLAARRAADMGPLTILCCDNLRNNGTILAQNFLSYLKLSGQKDLAAWVTRHCTFPCSMVDRITPAPPTRSTAEDALGTPIIGEDFIQWVIEDAFCAERPPLEAVGIQLVKDVHPYEETKIRVLNGGHISISFLGALAGYRKFDEAMDDAELREHFNRFERVEVQRAMPQDIPINVPDYIELIEGRFTNKSIGDAIERICTDGFAKMSIFIRPTLEGCFAAGQVPAFAIRSIAGWFHYARLVKLGARDYTYHEPNWNRLEPLLDRGDTSAFLNAGTLFGDLAERHPEFSHEFERQLQYLEQKWPV